MKKYFLKSNGQELKVGQVIELSVPVETSYGKGMAVTKVIVTEKTLTKLIADEFVIEVDPTQEAMKTALNEITPPLRALAAKANIDLTHAYMVCALLFDMSPTAHLSLLIESLAFTRNKGKVIQNDVVWWLHPGQGYNPSRITANNPLTNRGPVFYDYKDAIEAYNILQPLIKEFFDGK